MAKKQAIDTEKFEELRERAKDLQNSYAERDEMFKEYEDMYLMKWDSNIRGKAKSAGTTRLTISPTARNKILGACRLLYSQEPHFSVSAPGQSDEQVEELESSLRRWWSQAGHIGAKPIHYDMILSSCLYGEMHTAISLVDDYAKMNKDDKRVQKISRTTPVLFHSWNPRNGYPEFDELGLSAYYRTVETDWSTVAQKYRTYIEQTELADSNAKRTSKVQLNTFYDLTHFAVWVDDVPLYCAEHGLAQIPVDVTRTSGSGLFNDNEDKVQPMLYTLMKGNLWNHESLFLTVMYSQLFSIGVSPMYAYKSQENRAAPNIYEDNGVTLYVLGQNDSLDVLNNKGIMPPEIKSLADMTTNLIESSTIYSQAFGERGGGSATFSETSLLSQSARLPLIETQRLGGHGIGSTIELALATIRDRKINFDRNGYKLKGANIPEDIEVKVKLNVDLPQERLQQANLGIMLKNSRLVSDDYIHENILGIPNTNEMQRKIVEDQMAEGLIQFVTQEELRKLQAQTQRNDPINAAAPIIENEARIAEQANSGRPGSPGYVQPLTSDQQAERLINNMQSGAVPGIAGGAQGGMNAVPPEMAGMIPGTGLAGTPDAGGFLQ